MEELIKQLEGVQKTHPGDSFKIKLDVSPIQSYMLAFKRIESHKDMLSGFSRYRILDINDDVLYSAYDEKQAITRLVGLGVSESVITSKLNEMAIESLIILSTKNSYNNEYFSDQTREAAETRRVNLEARFEAVKNDPAALAQFIVDMASDNGFSTAPALSVVDDEVMDGD